VGRETTRSQGLGDAEGRPEKVRVLPEQRLSQDYAHGPKIGVHAGVKVQNLEPNRFLPRGKKAVRLLEEVRFPDFGRKLRTGRDRHLGDLLLLRSFVHERVAPGDRLRRERRDDGQEECVRSRVYLEDHFEMTHVAAELSAWERLNLVAHLL